MLMIGLAWDPFGGNIGLTIDPFLQVYLHLWSIKLQIKIREQWFPKTYLKG